MWVFAENLFMGVVLGTISFILVLYYIRAALAGKKFTLRVLPAIEAISDGVDRAVETGRPIFVTTGIKSDIRSGTYSPMVMAGLNIAKYTAVLAAQRGAEIIFLTPTTEGLVPVFDALYKQSAVEAGRPEAYKRENVVYFGPEVMLWAVCAQDIINEKGAALYVDVGAWTSDADIAGHFAAMDNGAISIGGTCRYHHQGSIYISCDYPLIMDEMYAAAAYCSGDQLVIGTTVASDIIKLIIIAIMIIGTLLMAVGLPFKEWLTL
ncbi:hypothetical protein DRO69_06275 [Candidatus Bathyarchaeota archaeon]|nr:MAG: hypothetical protein DRO69_06275 [Candidatus Bathyarchaeota archaeon]